MTKAQYPHYLCAGTNTDGNRGSPRIKEGLRNFIIDIDGVVSEDVPNEEPERMISAYEIPGSRECVNNWYDLGHIITFFTSRTENEREITVKWLDEKGYKYHNIIFGKPRGGNYHYIDDNRVRATTFDGKFGKLVKVQKEIEVFEC